MALIIDELNAVGAGNPVIRSSYGVLIDGLERTSYFGAGWQADFNSDDAYSACTLPVLQPFGLSEGRHVVELYAAWNGHPDLVFKGEIVATSQSYWQPRDTFTCGGFLKRTEAGLATAYAYCTAQDAIDALGDLDNGLGYTVVDLTADPTDAAIIVHILERYGITPGTTGHSIEASTWQPAKLLPILWDVGQPGWSIIQELDKCSPNSRTFEGRTGAVYRRQVFGTVPSRVRHIFAQGLDILDFEKSIEYSVWNKVIVRGAQIESLAQTDVEEDIEDQVIGISPVGAPVPSPFIPTPPGVRVDESIYSDYIETVPDAQMIADNLLGRLKQPLLQGTLATFGLPDMSTGDAIGISVPNRSFATNAFIVGHSINGQPLRSSFRWRGSTAAEARPNQPPLPAMTIEVAYEWMYVGDTLTKHAIITVDARTSSDSDGTVEAWTLAIGGTIYSGTDITLALVSHPTTAASPVAVTLTVTDDAGLSATLAQNATWDDSTVVIEPLTTAEKTLGAASTNGEQTWNEFTAPITAVAPIALGSGTLYFCSNGDIWRSTDLLETDPTKVATLPAAVNCAWNNEISTSRWICGLANGDIWLSVDDGVTWVKVGALPFPINDISESPHAPGQATAAAGNTLWTTFDLVNWSPLITHTAECLRFAAGMYGGVNVVYAGFADGTIKRYVD